MLYYLSCRTKIQSLKKFTEGNRRKLLLKSTRPEKNRLDISTICACVYFKLREQHETRVGMKAHLPPHWFKFKLLFVPRFVRNAAEWTLKFSVFLSLLVFSRWIWWTALITQRSVPFYRDVQIMFSDRRTIIHCQQSFLPCFLLLAPDRN